jgi:branched-chain amino acid transport system ATP-binding protein/branched-chain amino acid transport system permease protein
VDLRPERLTVGDTVVIAGLAAVFFAVPTLSPYALFVLALVGTRVVGALSLNVLMGYAGQVSLGQAAFVGVGAFCAAELAGSLPFPLPLVTAILAGALVATLVGLPSLRIRGLQVAATTLAFGVAAGGVLFARPWAGASSAGLALSRPTVLRGDAAFAAAVWGAVAAVLVADAAVRNGRLGRAFTAVRDREDNASAWGIAVNHTKLAAYAVSGAYAGLAGAMFAYLLQRVTPGPFDVWASLGLVAAVVIGGRGSVAGVVVAAAALTAAPELLRSLRIWAPLLGASMLVVVPTLRPEGLGWLLDRPLLRRSDGSRRSSASTEPLVPPARAVVLSVPRRTMLEIEDLHVRFGGLAAVAGVDLVVHRHEAVGLIGPNGAGKTTVFNCISGLVRPTSGRIRYRGLDLLALPSHARQGLGLARTFQQVGLCLPQTVWENLLIAQHPFAAPPQRAARARQALHVLGIDELAGARVGDLPHGEQRLVEIAAAVATWPQLLLLDEPAAGLSPHEAADLVERLGRLRADLGLSLLLIEHHLPVIMGLCDHVYVLVEGHSLTDGPPDQVQRDPAVVSAYLGGPSSEVIARAG